MTHPPAAKRRILIVDDNDDVRGILAIYLHKNGFDITEAIDGNAAIQLASTLEPALVLLDVLLPKIDGIEVLKRLRANAKTAHLPIILMSAVLNMRDLRKETNGLNVLAFLEKPFQVRNVVELINKGLAQEASGQPEPVAPAARPAETEAEDGDRLLFRRRELPRRGPIAEWPIPELLHSIFSASKTGKLTLEWQGIEKHIFIQNGLPVYAESSLPEETLGAHLLHRGRISQTQHASAVTEMTRSGRQFGEALLQLGILGPHDLFTELESHLTAKVIKSFDWIDGTFIFAEGGEWKDSVIVARMKPGRIMLDGIQRHWSPGSLYSRLKVTNDCRVFPLNESPYTQDQLALTAPETRILHLINKRITVSEIIRQVGNLDLVNTTLVSFYYMEVAGFMIEEQLDAGPAEPQNPSIVPSAPPRAVPGKEEQAKTLLAEYLKYRTADYFKLLGIPHEATTEQITAAFKERQERYHPNTLVGIDTGLVHEKIEELFVRIHEAYRTLIDPATRQKYLQSIHGSTIRAPIPQRTRSSFPAGANQRVTPDIHLWNDAIALLRNGKYGPAAQMFEQALSIKADMRYEAYFAWASYLADPARNRPRSEHKLRELHKQHPEEVLPPYLLGNLELKEDNSHTAEMYYESAVKLDPQHIESARQLRILRMRHRNRDPSGLLELFKKKN